MIWLSILSHLHMQNVSFLCSLGNAPGLLQPCPKDKGKKGLLQKLLSPTSWIWVHYFGGTLENWWEPSDKHALLKKKLLEGQAISLWLCLFLALLKGVQSFAAELNFVWLLRQVLLTIRWGGGPPTLPLFCFEASCINFLRNIFSQKSRNNTFLVPFPYHFMSLLLRLPTALFTPSPSLWPDFMLPSSPSSGCMWSVFLFLFKLQSFYSDFFFPFSLTAKT